MCVLRNRQASLAIMQEHTVNTNSSTANELAAVRVRDLDQYFPGISHSFKYGKLLPQLDTFHIGRIQFATLGSIHRLVGELAAAAAQKPQAKRRGRPRKVQPGAQEGAAA
jgi:hypothetical protein